MPLGNLLTAIDPTVEKVTITFNFAPWLGPGVTITNVVSVTAINSTPSLEQDPNPQAIVFGPPQIVTSPVQTNQPASAVLQQVADCQPNVTYLLECLVDTSDNQQMNLATRLPCVQLN